LLSTISVTCFRNKVSIDVYSADCIAYAAKYVISYYTSEMAIYETQTGDLRWMNLEFFTI
jgi:hypothetical protein